MGFGGGGGGVGGGGDAGEFAGVAAGEFAADDVGVLGQGGDGGGVEVGAAGGGGVIVDEEGDGGGGGDVGEVGGQGGGGEEGMVVGRGEDEGVVAAGGEGFAGEFDGLAGGLGTAADDDGEVGEAGVVKGFAGGLGHEFPLEAGEVDGLSVRSLGGNASHAGFGESDGMRGHGGKIEIFVVMEKGHRGHVHARFEGSTDIVDGGGGGALGRLAILRSRVDGLGRWGVGGSRWQRGRKIMTESARQRRCR